MLVRGTKPLLDALLESVTDSTDPALWGRGSISETLPKARTSSYNQGVEGTVLLVNSLARPGPRLANLTSRNTPFAALTRGRLVAARVEASSLKPGVLGSRQVSAVSKPVERLEVDYDALFEGYWDLVESNGLAIVEQAKGAHDPLALHPSVELRGPPQSLKIDSGADVERFVSFDTRLGPIVVEPGATIESFSRVMGPCYVGPKVKVMSALIGGGTSIFGSSKVGGQVENSIISAFTNKAHHGYVGDSYVGEWVNLGAGCTFSNLKNTYGDVRVAWRGRKRDTKMVKLGPMVGDLCKVSIGALVYSGRSAGTGSHLAGTVSADVPAFTYCGGRGENQVELKVDSVVETQRRMMGRRGLELSRGMEALIRLRFKETAQDRRRAGVRRGALS